MGIHGLTKLLGDHAPSSMKENEIKNYFGRKIAIDASMSIYQFLIAVRSDGSQLTNESGETTSHLMGLFYRTIRMLDNGIKPVYVFDGKPPKMKSGELAKRTERREEAQKQLDKANETGDQENIDKFSRRLVKVTPQHNQECKQLLDLMGIPYVDAPCEAEAQCAELVKGGKVYAMGSEDMDSLTFGTNILLRHLTFSEARKMPIQEFHYDKVLNELELSKEQFIDLCILLGCDYCDSIKGVGPVTAIKLIKEHKSLEEIVKKVDGKKYKVPDNWMFEDARELFLNPEVTPADKIDLKWREPDEEKLVEYMVKDKGFSEDRIRNGAKKILKAKKTSAQGRMDSFFKVIPSNKPVKRKSEEKTPAKKKTKTGGGKFKGK
ncbi:flap endonuclease 1-like [Hydractinia symbiolongicarpus]|uniref:flap endonuclease 1-like n=1 Tax=Hydractinia symbiolongicarpus TaxID=13093 RepID=UPI00254B4E1A|nr:flap endonuclease 1-like [Hydractinia symbiolongicarpus]